MMMTMMMADRLPRGCVHLDTLPHPLRPDAGSGGGLQVRVLLATSANLLHHALVSRSNLAILLYLTLDAAHLGVLAAFWAAAFLTERMPRMVTIIMMTVVGTLTSVMMTGPHDHPLPPHLLRPVRLDDRVWLLSQAGGARVGQVGSLLYYIIIIYK